jgi:hypothetical protein
MTLPNFIIFGAGRSGTTSTFHYLKQHPQIFLGAIKDSYFFSLGEDLNLNGIPQATLDNLVSEFEKYQALFDNALPRQVAIGEVAVSSLRFLRAAQRIQKYIPNAKLIAIFRHPAERAFSQHVFQCQLGYESFFDFEQALALENERIEKMRYDHLFYRRNGLYARQLKKYFEMFPRHQFQFHLYEDLQDNPTSMFRKIFNFLNVDDNVAIDTSIKYQVGYLPKSSGVNGLLNRKNPLRSFMRNLIPLSWREPIKARLNKSNRARSAFDPQLRAELTEYYREDILQLQDMIGRDLSHWLS